MMIWWTLALEVSREGAGLKEDFSTKNERKHPAVFETCEQQNVSDMLGYVVEWDLKVTRCKTT